MFGDTVYGRTEETAFLLIGKQERFMPHYTYTAYTSWRREQKVEGSIEAASKDVAILLLRKAGIAYVTSIQREEQPPKQSAQITSQLKINSASKFDTAPQISVVVERNRLASESSAVPEHNRIALTDCPACHCRVSSQAAACPRCGQPIRPMPQGDKPQSRQTSGMISCHHCKKSTPRNTKYCPECGALISGPVPWWFWCAIIGSICQLLGFLIKKGII